MSNFKTSHAFIIGINDYKYVMPLQTAVNDAQKLAEVLNQEIHGYRTSTYPNAKVHELRTLLDELPTIVKENDRVLFYFAGHGVAMDNEEDLPQGYLLPADADKNNIANTFISMNELYAALDTLPCRHLLLVLDCCFSGAFKWTGSSRKLQIVPKRIYKELFDQYVSDRAWEVITSASYNETALDTVRGYGVHGLAEENTDHSPFAYALFKGLEGEADIIPKEKDGIITAKELHLYLRQKVTPMSIRIGKHSNKYRQTPSIFSLPKDDRGEYIFLTKDFRKANLLDRPNQNPYKGLASYTLEDADYFYGREESITEVMHLVEGNPLTFIQIPAPKDSSNMHQTVAEELKRMSTYSDFHVLQSSDNVLEDLNNIVLPTNSYEVDLENKLKNRVLFVLQYDKWSAKERLLLEKQLLKWLRPQVPTFKVVLTVSTNFEATYPQNSLKEYWNKSDFVSVSTDFEENKTKALQGFHQQIEGNPFTVVTGMSGSGKSSLVQAGVLPKLKESERYQHRLVIHPLETDTLLESLQFAYAKEKVLKEQVFNKKELSEEELKKKIAKEKEELSKQGIESKLQNTILVIDQYEYLLTQSSPEKRKTFEKQLLKYLDANIHNFKVIITIRSDFEGSFREATLQPYWANKHRFIAKPFGLGELKQIIALPAAQYNVDFEEGLVDTIASEVYNQVGAMPLLSFALSTLYEKCVDGENRTIGKADYEEVGGVTNILHGQASEVYKSFDSIARNGSDLCTEAKQCQKTMKKLMLRMVAQEGSDYAGRRVFLKELEYRRKEENTIIEIVINQLLGKRLIVKGLDKQTNQEYIAPAHDALIKWNQLQEWIKDITATMGLGVFQRLREDIEANKTGNTASNKKINLWDKNPSLDIVNEEREYAMTFRTADEQERLRRLKSGAAWQLIKDLVNVKRRKTNTDTLLNKVEDEFVKQSLKKRVESQRKVARALLLILFVLAGALVFSLENQKYTEAGLAFAEAGNSLKAEYNVEKTLEQLNLGFQKANSLWASSWRQSARDTFYTNEVGQQTWNTLHDNGYIRSYNHPNNALINDVFISPDEKYILTASDDKSVIVWKTDTNLIEKQIDSSLIQNKLNSEHLKVDKITYPDKVVRVVMSPNSKFIVSGLANGCVYISKVNTTKTSIKISKPDFLVDIGGSVHLVDFSDSTSYFLVATNNRAHLYKTNNFEIFDIINADWSLADRRVFATDSILSYVLDDNLIYRYFINSQKIKKIYNKIDVFSYKRNYFFLANTYTESFDNYILKRWNPNRPYLIEDAKIQTGDLLQYLTVLNSSKEKIGVIVLPKDKNASVLNVQNKKYQQKIYSKMSHSCSSTSGLFVLTLTHNKKYCQFWHLNLN